MVASVPSRTAHKNQRAHAGFILTQKHFFVMFRPVATNTKPRNLVLKILTSSRGIPLRCPVVIGETKLQDDRFQPLGDYSSMIDLLDSNNGIKKSKCFIWCRLQARNAFFLSLSCTDTCPEL